MPFRVLALCLCPCLVFAVVGPLALAQQPPHVPTEEQWKKERTGIKSDGDREYQQRGVETVQSWLDRAVRWLKDLLARIHLTPARLALGLGILGSLYTWGKNKRLVRWAVMAGFSYLLAIVGLAAMVFNWAYWN
jgi:hypothetical protein